MQFPTLSGSNAAGMLVVGSAGGRLLVNKTSDELLHSLGLGAVNQAFRRAAPARETYINLQDPMTFFRSTQSVSFSKAEAVL